MRACHVIRLITPLAALVLVPGTASSGASRTTGSPLRLPAAARAATGAGVTITRTFNAQALAACLLGPGLTVTSATLTAATPAVGAFTAGASVLGIEAGVVLSTGDIDSLARTNQIGSMSTDNFAPGDASLDALLDPGTGIVSFDAAVLVIDFTAPAPGTLNLSYVFGSEEYNEYVDDDFNDVFAIFLDGTAPANNIALTSGACASSPGLRVAINSVNCGSDGTDTGAPNCACFRDNTLGSIETELDGLTQVFIASAPLSAGPHQLKLAIGDAADSIYDTAVFLACQSGQVPTTLSTWGRLKSMYR